jgi:hypothetical protein
MWYIGSVVRCDEDESTKNQEPRTKNQEPRRCRCNEEYMTDQNTQEQTARTAAGTSTQPAPLPNEPYYQQQQGRFPRQASRLGVVLLVVGMIWLAVELFSGSSSRGPITDGSALIDEQLSGTSIALNVGDADVQIVPSDASEIGVVVTYEGGSPQDYDVNVRPNGDRVDVTAHIRPCVFCSRALRIDVAAPSGVAVNVETTNGEINAEGIRAPAELVTLNGDIQAQDLSESLIVRTTNGSVDLSNIAGKLNVTSTNGDVELEDGQVTGAVVSLTNGDAELYGVSEELRLENVNGDLMVVDGNVSRMEIVNTNGDISYSGLVSGSGPSSIINVSGDVSLELDEDSHFTLNASTTSGDISEDVDLTDEQQGSDSFSGATNPGAATLEVKTTNGDISVEQR